MAAFAFEIALVGEGGADEFPAGGSGQAVHDHRRGQVGGRRHPVEGGGELRGSPLREREELIAGLQGQGWYVSSTEQAGEALAIARRSGLSVEQFHAVIGSGRMRSPFYDTFMQWTLAGDENAHRFTISNAHKDMRYLSAMANEAAVCLKSCGVSPTIPALPRAVFWLSGLLTAPIEAMHSDRIRRSSPDCSFTCA